MSPLLHVPVAALDGPLGKGGGRVLLDGWLGVWWPSGCPGQPMITRFPKWLRAD